MNDKTKNPNLRESGESETTCKLGEATTDDAESERPKLEVKYYRTQPGDSILKVAFVFNMSVPALKRLNGIISDDLYPGQIVKVEILPTSDLFLHPELDSLLADTEEEAKGIGQPSNLKRSFASQGTTPEPQNLTGILTAPKHTPYGNSKSTVLDFGKGGLDFRQRHMTMIDFPSKNEESLIVEAPVMTHTDIQSQFGNI